MRVALIQNVNNNHYQLAKLLRGLKVEADLYVSNHDHYMAQPEWEEGEFDAATVPTRYPPWSWIPGRNGWRRPEWVKDLPDPTWHRLPFADRELFLKEMEWKLNGRLKWHQHGVVNAALRGLRLDELTFEETSRFFDIYRWAKVVHDYDLIQVQSWSIIDCLVGYPSKPYVLHDYGQPLREIVFEDSTRGRLFRAAYQHADAVVLMNPDTREAAEQLGLKNYVFIGYPVDEGKYSPGPSAVRAEIEQRYGKGVTMLFAPARQDPEGKGSEKVLHAFGQLIREASSPSVVLVLITWGEVDRAKLLIQELGVEEYVRWLGPISRNKMLDYYRAADVVLDQFVLGTLGRVSFEGMACAKPVLCYFRPETHDWCYPELPPLCSAHSEQEILEWLVTLVREPSLRRELSWRGRRWIEKHFSGERTARAYADLYQQILERNRQYVLERDRLRLEGGR